MPRTKIKMAYISDDSTRKSSLRRRKKGLIKKTKELSLLCEVMCCLVIYSPNCPEPDIWPSRPETEQVIQKYKGMPGFERSKKMENQESFAQEKLVKAQEQLSKIHEENRVKRLGVMLNKNMSSNRSWVQNLDNDYLTYMNTHVLTWQLEEIERRIAMLNLEPNAEYSE